MIFESKDDALVAYPDGKTAMEIVATLKDVHGYVLHATNVGQEAVKLNSPYVEFKPLNQQGKPSKLYLSEGFEKINRALIKKAERRKAFGQDVYS